MNIIIGSKNPAKIQAVQNVFKDQAHKVISMDIPSGVSEQPFSDEETICGAKTRALNALEKGNGDIGIGLEGGVQETSLGLMLCNWGALAVNGMEPIIAGGARLLLPEEISARLRAGGELGPVMDDYANKENVSKNEGAIGIFTNGFVNRDEMFVHIINLLVGQFEYKMKRILTK